jgi:hypothetical protein
MTRVFSRATHEHIYAVPVFDTVPNKNGDAKYVLVTKKIVHVPETQRDRLERRCTMMKNETLHEHVLNYIGQSYCAS